VVGTLDSKQKFVTYVASFEKIYEKVTKNPQIRYHNKRNSQFDVFLSHIYSVLDIISLVVILGLFYKSSKNQNIGQKFGGQFNKTKNFEMTKNVNVKFKDVAGLHESKREVQ
jgi:ATP-dependent Zn protease